MRASRAFPFSMPYLIPALRPRVFARALSFSRKPDLRSGLQGPRTGGGRSGNHAGRFVTRWKGFPWRPKTLTLKGRWNRV